jgi:hypothetical protein
MNAINRENRKMDGGLIWLNLIPILNLIWPIIFNYALKVSYKKEFRTKGIRQNVNLSSGLIYPSFQLLSLVILCYLFFSEAKSYGSYDFYRYPRLTEDSYQNILIGSIIIGVLGLLSFILWIVFWVNTIKYKNMSRLYEDGRDLIQSSTAETIITSNDHSLISSSKDAIKENQTLNDTKIIKEQPIESPFDKIKKYHDMLNEGLINQSDFDRIKKEILNQ